MARGRDQLKLLLNPQGQEGIEVIEDCAVCGEGTCQAIGSYKGKPHAYSSQAETSNSFITYHVHTAAVGRLILSIHLTYILHIL